MAEDKIRATYDRNLAIFGCGYWSVCDDHACPCSPDSKVAQGFSREVWDNMRKNMMFQED